MNEFQVDIHRCLKILKKTKQETTKKCVFFSGIKAWIAATLVYNRLSRVFCRVPTIRESFFTEVFCAKHTVDATYAQ